jgi:hypothetical protein
VRSQSTARPPPTTTEITVTVTANSTVFSTARQNAGSPKIVPYPSSVKVPPASYSGRLRTDARTSGSSGTTMRQTRTSQMPPWIAPSVTRPQRRAGSARTIDGGMDSPTLIVVRLPAYRNARRQRATNVL